MERLLGRPATKADVDASMRIPAPERLRIVGGVDVERARRTGRDEYVARLAETRGRRLMERRVFRVGGRARLMII